MSTHDVDKTIGSIDAGSSGGALVATATGSCGMGGGSGAVATAAAAAGT